MNRLHEQVRALPRQNHSGAASEMKKPRNSGASHYQFSAGFAQAKFFAAKSQLTTFQNASTYFGRALR